MTIGEIYNLILENLPDKSTRKYGWHGFWVNKYDDEIMCETEDQANTIADFLEDMGFDCVHTHWYDPKEENGIEDCIGWWSVYLDS